MEKAVGTDTPEVQVVPEFKTTGIIRRIDDLGRVVIPRDLRHSLGFKEDDPLEFGLNPDGSLCLRRYHPMCTASEQIARIKETVCSDFEMCKGHKELHRVCVELSEAADLLEKAEHLLQSAEENRDYINLQYQEL